MTDTFFFAFLTATTRTKVVSAARLLTFRYYGMFSWLPQVTLTRLVATSSQRQHRGRTFHHLHIIAQLLEEINLLLFGGTDDTVRGLKYQEVFCFPDLFVLLL